MRFLEFFVSVFSSPLFVSLVMASNFYVVFPWMVNCFVRDLLRQAATQEHARRNQPPGAPAKHPED